MSASARMLAAWMVAGLLLLPVANRLRGQEEKAEPAKPLVIPEEEKARKNPIPSAEESIAIGRKLFSSQCAACHGKQGDGKGDLAQELKFAVPDFTQAEQQKKRTDGELFYILTAGHQDMPGQGERLRPLQKWHLINFIRSLAPPEKPQGK